MDGTKKIELITTKEAASRLKIHWRTLIRWWKDGRLDDLNISPVQFGRYHRWSAEDITTIKKRGLK
jgi:excisionase family DNA binding protein